MKIVAIGAAALALAVGGLLVGLRIEHATALTLPPPTGDFAVGRALLDWSDPATPYSLAPVPGAARELLVWLWYPAAPRESPPQVSPPRDDRHAYLPRTQRAAAEHVLGPLLGGFLTRDLTKVYTYATWNVPLATRASSYPVAIIRGGASLAIYNYSSLATDLASHGYVVVGFDAPYLTSVVAFPDGRVMRRTNANNPELAIGAPDSARRITRIMNAWTSDVGFVLDRLAALDVADSSGRFRGRLDLRHVGVFGHSLGGATALQFCHDDSRCAAGVDIDGAPLGSVIRDGVQQPFMFLLSGKGDQSSSDAEDREILANIQSIYDREPKATRARAVIRGANHFTFSDDGALLKSKVIRALMHRFGVLDLDGPRQLAITEYCVRTFFDAYLKGAAPKAVVLSSRAYPELLVDP